jgi:hypothetical protein
MLLVMLAVACKAGDGAIVVTVDADPPLSSVALLKATVSEPHGSNPRIFDVKSLPAPTIPPHLTFAVVANARVGKLTIHLDAWDADGHKRATGDGTANVVSGGRTDLTIKLGPPLRGSFVSAGATQEEAGGVHVRGTFQWQGSEHATATNGKVTLTGWMR